MTYDDNFREAGTLAREAQEQLNSIRAAMFDAKHNAAYAKAEMEACKNRLYAVAEGGNQKQRDAWVEQMLGTDEEFLEAHARFKEAEADAAQLEVQESTARTHRRLAFQERDYIIAKIQEATA